MTEQEMIEFICSHLDGKELEEIDAQSDTYYRRLGDTIFLCFRDANDKERSFMLTVEEVTW